VADCGNLEKAAMPPMLHGKRVIIIALWVCAIAVPVCSARSRRGKAKPKHPAVSELLDKFAETQDKVQSFIAKTESLAETVSSNPRYKGRKRYYRTLSEIRSDGEPEYALRYMWIDISSSGEVKSKDEASYLSNLWDGKSFLSYARDKRNYLGSVIINRASEYRIPDRILAGSGDGTAMGYCHGDGIRVDSILRKADTISVRDKTEQISGSACYVIEAETKYGKHTLWIDPKHGYNLAKVVVRKRKGDLSGGRPIPRGTLSSSLENVRFEKVDGVWVPMEWDIKLRAYWLDDYLISKTHDKRTAITLNPDHEALGSFVPDDIKNGAKVYIQQVPGVHYIWQDGKVVDEKGRTVELEKVKFKSKKE
jgi:hypothetical protein